MVIIVKRPQETCCVADCNVIRRLKVSVIGKYVYVEVICGRFDVVICLTAPRLKL
jgi:hypothetical protein